MKPFAESSEQNKQVILDVLKDEFADCKTILEVGSGTGQHAVFFSEQLPHLDWQPSDIPQAVPGIQMWCDEFPRQNLLPPIVLDVANPSHWPARQYDAVFSANAVHIMSWQHVQAMFAGLEQVMADDFRLCLYGPFNFEGNYTSESNAQFDVWLKQRDPVSGIRHFEELDALARQVGLKFARQVTMPVNNFILAWER